MKKSLCLSGGGSKGAWGASVAQYLVEEKQTQYDILTGTSTGAMIITLVATSNFTKLKSAYTTVTSKDIFKVNPFKTNSIDMSLDAISIIDNLTLRKQITFGDSSNMSATIKKFFSEQDYELIKQSGKSVIACVTNLTKEQTEYYDIKDVSYEDACLWIQASGSFAPFMSVIEKNGCQYMDGGTTVVLPIQEAIDRGATEIDVIVLDPKGNSSTPSTSKNVFQLIARITDTMSSQIMSNDELIGSLEAKLDDVTLNVYYTPTVLTTNSLDFNKQQMLQWWEQGYEYAKNNKPEQVIIKR